MSAVAAATAAGVAEKEGVLARRLTQELFPTCGGAFNFPRVLAGIELNDWGTPPLPNADFALHVCIFLAGI